MTDLSTSTPSGLAGLTPGTWNVDPAHSSVGFVACTAAIASTDAFRRRGADVDKPDLRGMVATMSKTIVLIHGAWLTPACCRRCTTRCFSMCGPFFRASAGRLQAQLHQGQVHLRRRHGGARSGPRG